jgi:hypothetical protein
MSDHYLRVLERMEAKSNAEITRLREENARLREALKPFAYIAEHVGEEDARWAVPSAHLRAAAAAIREGGKDG